MDSCCKKCGWHITECRCREPDDLEVTVEGVVSYVHEWVESSASWDVILTARNGWTIGIEVVDRPTLEAGQRVQIQIKEE